MFANLTLVCSVLFGEFEVSFGVPMLLFEYIYIWLSHALLAVHHWFGRFGIIGTLRNEEKVAIRKNTWWIELHWLSV